MSEQKSVSVIIISFNTQGSLRDCLLGICGKDQSDSTEIIVVDNASEDGSAGMVKNEFPKVRLIENEENKGFAAAVNQGAAYAQGKYLVLLNSDAIPEKGALDEAVREMNQSPNVAAGGGLLMAPDGTPQPSARMFPSLINLFLVISGLAAKYPRSSFFGRFDRTWANPYQPAKVDWVPGAFMILRKEIFRRLGGMDESFFLYYEEVDLCRRMKRQGYTVWYWPAIRIFHRGGESAKNFKGGEVSLSGGQLILWRLRSQYLYFRKHYGFFYAWLSRSLEKKWCQMRLLRNKKGSRKFVELQATLRFIDQAWRETRGGQISPPRPWR